MPRNLNGPEVPPCYYRVAVKALITNKQGKLLLVKEGNDNWDLPGGGLEHGEAPHHGLKREIFEELGIGIKTIAKKPYDIYSFVAPIYNQFVICILYEVELGSENFKLGQGVYAIEYLNKNDIITYAHELDKDEIWEGSVDLWQVLVEYLKLKFA